MQESRPLSELEIELLECASMAGEATRVLDERMLENSPGRVAVEKALRDLLDLGLVTTVRNVYAGPLGVFEDDWWDVTPAGRAAIGLPPKPPRPSRTV
jgi:hypothetical protein